MGGDPEITRVEAKVGDARVAGFGGGGDAPAEGVAGDADFVEFLVAADDEGFAGAGETEGVGEDGANVFAGYADHAGFVEGGGEGRGGGGEVSWVGEGAEEVEDCAPGELASDGGDVAHTWVEDGGEEEGVVGAAVEGCYGGGADAGDLGG